MNRLIAHSLIALALAIGAAGAQAPNVQEKQIVPLIKANWIAFRNYSGRQFIYFSNLLAYRCGLTEIRYSVNSDALDRVFPLPPAPVSVSRPHQHIVAENTPPAPPARAPWGWQPPPPSWWERARVLNKVF